MSTIVLVFSARPWRRATLVADDQLRIAETGVVCKILSGHLTILWVYQPSQPPKPVNLK